MLKKLEVQLPEHRESTTESEVEPGEPSVEEKIQNRLKHADRNNAFKLPVRFRDKSLANFNGMREKVDLCIQSLKEQKSLFLSGSCGSGKTHLACALMPIAFEDYLRYPEKYRHLGYSFSARFLPTVEFFLQLKSTFRNDSQVSEEEIVGEWSAHALLVIDDLGAEKMSDWTRQGLYTLIDRRYRQMKATIITSNLSLEEIGKQVDDRIASRIVEVGPVINLGDKDYRLNLK